MVEQDASSPGGCAITPVLAALEAHLSELDLLGSTLAAAHLDAAIHQLRLDEATRLFSVFPEEDRG